MYKGAIGIVGGLGPYAGLDLMTKLFDATKASSDQDHVPVIQISFPHKVVNRTAFLLGKIDENPGEAIGTIMQTLAQAGASVIGMPCNTAHSPKILETALSLLHAKHPDVRFVHIIDAVIATLKAQYPHVRKVGVLSTMATFETGLYQNALQKAGFQATAPDEAGRMRVQASIEDTNFGIKACSTPVSDTAKNLLLAEANALAKDGATAIVLGCTEIPLALSEASFWCEAVQADIPFIDATKILAYALLDTFAPEKRKKRT